MEILKKTAALRVAAQTKDKAPDEVHTISLSGVPLLPDLLSPFTHLTELTLVGMKPRLVNLNVLPESICATLLTLDLADNAITVPAPPPPCPQLRTCKLGNNKIATLDEVGLLAAQMPRLELLDLEDNAVSSSDAKNNFAAIFALFPALQALNYKNRDGEEVTEEDSEEDEEDSGDDDDEEDDELIASSSSSLSGEGSKDEDEEGEDEDEETLEQPTKKARAEA